MTASEHEPRKQPAEGEASDSSLDESSSSPDEKPLGAVPEAGLETTFEPEEDPPAGDASSLPS